MTKIFSIKKEIFSPVMLLLCGLFLHSCTEEMPILTPNSAFTSGISAIVFKVNNTPYTIVNKVPGYVYFANVTVGSNNNLYSQYNISGSNGSQTYPIDYLLTFGPDSTNTNNFVFGTSQVTINKKTYSTINANGKAKLTIDKIDTNNNTAAGSFSYYVYNSVFSPTDSIYVSGTFNIVK
jgi:hypothetical protein